MKDDKTHVLSIPPAAKQVKILDVLGASERVGRLDRLLCEQLLRALGEPPIALQLWNAERIALAAGDIQHVAHIRDRASLLRLLANPELHFGDAYASGRIEIDGDLARFLETVYRHLGRVSAGRLARLAEQINRPRQNTHRGSRDNIHHHYDLGNAFFQLWLDDEMVYTCAYFPDPDMSLEAAQWAKMDHICRKLRLRSGERVVEAGCGWGSLARHMARHYGVRVRAFNISEQQVDYARERARREGLDDRIEYVLDDYRSIHEDCDAFVSVGMLEHVGKANYEGFGNVIARSLAPNGRGLLHSIGRSQARLMNAWIERRIFPGAYPPTLSEMMQVLEPHAFAALDVENLRLHYAKTLEHWLARFERISDQVRARYDQAFERAWRLYLAGSLAAFRVGSLQLYQVLFTRASNNELPWTRADLYH